MVPLKYQMVIQWSEEDQSFLVSFPDFPGQQWRTHGNTHIEAATNGFEALESLIMAYAATGDPLPKLKVIRLFRVCGDKSTLCLGVTTLSAIPKDANRIPLYSFSHKPRRAGYPMIA